MLQLQTIKKNLHEYKLKPFQTQVWFVDLSEYLKEINQFKSILSTDELARADKFHFEIDKARFIYSKGILRCLLCLQTGIRPELLRFMYNNNLKPEISNEQNSLSLNFNISHSQHALCIAIANNLNLGVDIEFLKPIPDLKELSSKYFSASENKQLLELPEEKILAGFYSCWTKKEAVVKALGEGLSVPLKDFDVSVMPKDKPGIIEGRNVLKEKLKNYQLESFYIGDEFIGAVAVDGNIENIMLLKLDSYEELISVIKI
ncbi:MAG TPA: 4'-phosphopantetheinyl transferase superfamily protein [Ignavibacteriaceae bacterium]|jgi:4'-phosphopantetheinyl transferase